MKIYFILERYSKNGINGQWGKGRLIKWFTAKHTAEICLNESLNSKGADPWIEYKVFEAEVQFDLKENRSPSKAGGSLLIKPSEKHSAPDLEYISPTKGIKKLIDK